MSNVTRDDAVTVLPEGTLRFRIQRSDGSETEHDADIILLKLASEQCEEKHSLEVRDGRYVPTPAFLKDLAEQYAELGINECTPTVAHLIWVTVSAEFAKLKKTTDGTQ